MALDRRNYHQVVETKVEVVQKAGVLEIVGKIISELKDEAEPCHKMVLGASDIDEWLEMRLIDGIIYRSKQRRIKLCIRTLPRHGVHQFSHRFRMVS
jgi:splicing factor 3B subunit 1